MGLTLQPNTIIAGFKQNDPIVLRQVYNNVFPKVKTHLLKNNGTEAQAKDIFQEAFVACWRNIKDDKLKANSNVEAYLFTIAKNKWTDHLRSSAYKKRVSTSDLGTVEARTEETNEIEAAWENKRNAIVRAMEQLGEQCKSLLGLFYFERKSMQEIAQQLKIAPNSARNQKYRCMEKLRTLSLEIKNHG